MKNIKRIYMIMLHYWGFLIAGLFFMVGYALFSGISIMLAVPLLDHVFKKNETQIIYSNLTSFMNAVQVTIQKFTSTHSFTLMFDKSNYGEVWSEFKIILNHTDPMLLLWTISVSIIVLIMLKNIFFYGNRIMFINLRGRVIEEIRNKMFHSYLYQSLTFFNKNNVGDSLVRISSDVDIVSDLFIGSIFEVIRDLLLVLIYIQIAVTLNLKLFLIGLVLFPFFGLIINYIGKKIKKYSKRIQKQTSDMFSKIEEVLQSIRIVKAFSKENHEKERFYQINNKFFLFWKRTRLYQAIGTPVSEINGTITGVIVLLIGGRQVILQSEAFTFGSFMAFLLAVFSMQHPIKTITKTYTNIKKAVVSLDRISVILNRKTEITENINNIEKKTFDSKIEFKNVLFNYNGKSEVLKHINLEICKGEKIAIVGGSGSGKTTLVTLLTRMYDPISGKILIDGVPSNQIKLKDLRTLFGTVTQESILFNETIHNNISYGSFEEASDEQVAKAAEIAFADEFIEKLPQKYDEMLQTKASNLSGGQKQRLCIARAIVGNPPILIFDEATSSLDTESERKVQVAINHATENRTVIVIAHRLSTILSSDKIVVMNDGKILDIGKHEELLNRNEKYQILYKLQFEQEK